jgi:hypothetical protein
MNRTAPMLLLAAALLGLGTLTGCDDDDDIFDDDDDLAAVLSPVPAVDASARLDLEEGPGAFDELDVEFELDEDDFDVFDVDTGDGFGDEDVVLSIWNGNQQIYSADLEFDRDRRATEGDVVWDFFDAGGNVPDLRAGDVAEISVNGVLAVRGTLHSD